MKKNKYSIISKIASVFFILAIANSCNTVDFDKLDTPNSLTPNQADLDLFINSMELNFAYFVENVSDETTELTRMKHMFGPTYANAYGPTTFDSTWRIYSSFLTDARTLVPAATAQGLTTHTGISKVLEAYILVTLVDVFGDIPYSEALDPNNLNPALDSGADVYAAAMALVNDALVDFGTTPLSAPTNDYFYAGDRAKWIKMANTLKLKMHLTTGLVNGATSTAAINALITEDNFIDTTSDFEFPWSSTQNPVDSRHPLYGSNYDNASSSSHYMSTGYMYEMLNGKTNRDPRTRYYFYRQSSSNTGDVNEQSCITKPKPGHYSASTPYCNVNFPADSQGYWGRDHGNADGIPPDANLKTTYGIYPVGGNFDANQEMPVKDAATLISNGNGAGITPILLTSYVHFMRAAAALELGTSDNATTQLEAGIRASITKVTGFLPGVSRFDLGTFDDDGNPVILPADLSVTPVEIENYVLEVIGDFATATGADKLDIAINEYYLALFGNGIEAYNNYRRTSFPSDLQPTILANPGPFMRTFLYPSVLVNLNINVAQKTDLTVRTFWDTNTNPLF
jgi:hypothetical protein